MSNDPINEHPPEESSGSIRDPVPSLSYDEFMSEFKRVHDYISYKHFLEQLRYDSVLVSKTRMKGLFEEYRRNIERKIEWIVPFGFFMTFIGILITIHTSSFSTSLLWMTKDFLLGSFYILTILSFALTARAVFKSWNAPDISIDHIIDEMESYRPKPIKSPSSLKTATIRSWLRSWVS